MFYLFLSIFCSVLIANLLMVTGKKAKLNMLPVFLGNYFVASLFSFISLPRSVALPSGFDLGFGVLTGLLFLTNFWVYQRSIVFNGLSLSVGVMRIAMIVPVVLALVLWDLNYFFKSYHHFFKSAVLWVCDITIFSNEYHDYCKSSYHFLSRR